LSDIAPALIAEDLPARLADVAEAIGLVATLKLVTRFGGIRVYVPRPEYITEDHELARAIGLDAARKLAQLCVGERFSVPRAAKAIRRARDRALVRDRRSMSIPQCAHKYRITERQVYWIVGHAEKEKNNTRQSYRDSERGSQAAKKGAQHK
jgi:Mor family transcriptional regulator